MMTARRIILGFLAASLISGCNGLTNRWPLGKKPVPVTHPTESRPIPPDDLPAPPADEPAEPVAVIELVQPTAPAETTIAEAPEPPRTPPAVSTSVLQVNNQVITVDEILLGLHEAIAAIPQGVSEESFRRKVQTLIAEEIPIRVRQTLVLVEAEKSLTDAHKKAIDADMEQTLRKMIVSAGGSKTKLRQNFAKLGFGLKAVLAEHRRRLVIQSYLRAKLLPAIVVNRRMLWEHYQQHAAEFSSPKRVQMQIVAAPFTAFLPGAPARPTEWELYAAKVEARKHIVQAVEALQKGEGFGDVAAEMSRGLRAWASDEPPLTMAGSFIESEVEAAAHELDEGHSRGVITTDSGYYIVKAKRVEPGKILPFEDAQEQIEFALRKQQYEKLQGKYLQRLWPGITVSPSRKFIELATERAVKRYRKR